MPTNMTRIFACFSRAEKNRRRGGYSHASREQNKIAVVDYLLRLEEQGAFDTQLEAVAFPGDDAAGITALVIMDNSTGSHSSCNEKKHNDVALCVWFLMLCCVWFLSRTGQSAAVRLLCHL
jgi:hypothetical protein